MTDSPNYRAIEPPDDKPPTDYTYVERRAELFDMLDRAGHYRNLPHSLRALGRRYSVSHEQVRKDIQRVNEWKAEHMGEHAEAELETLKNAAIDDLLEQGEVADAYHLMRKHYATLQEMGLKSKAAKKVQHDSPKDPTQTLGKEEREAMREALAIRRKRALAEREKDETEPEAETETAAD